MTIYKAQGFGFREVIVIVDKLFNMSMLYTAITRASMNVLFKVDDLTFPFFDLVNNYHFDELCSI